MPTTFDQRYESALRELKVRVRAAAVGWLDSFGCPLNRAGIDLEELEQQGWIRAAEVLSISVRMGGFDGDWDYAVKCAALSGAHRVHGKLVDHFRKTDVRRRAAPEIAALASFATSDAESELLAKETAEQLLTDSEVGPIVQIIIGEGERPSNEMLAEQLNLDRKTVARRLFRARPGN